MSIFFINYKFNKYILKIFFKKNLEALSIPIAIESLNPTPCQAKGKFIYKVKS